MELYDCCWYWTSSRESPNCYTKIFATTAESERKIRVCNKWPTFMRPLLASDQLESTGLGRFVLQLYQHVHRHNELSNCLYSFLQTLPFAMEVDFWQKSLLLCARIYLGSTYLPVYGSNILWFSILTETLPSAPAVFTANSPTSTVNAIHTLSLILVVSCIGCVMKV
jgi:hypothetical protein